MNNAELHTEKLIKGLRTYFFDIKKSERGDLYLKISESKKTNSGFEHHQIMVFDEDIKDFVDTFSKVIIKFEELKNPILKENISDLIDKKAYSVEKIRQTHEKAYMPWTLEDDRKLELLFCEGKKVNELAQIFGRNDGAIRSRIKKLELEEKYIW